MSDSLGLDRSGDGALIDRLCDEFEQGWLGGRPARVGDVVRSAPEHIRPALLRELLALDREYREQEGHPVPLSETVEQVSFLGSWAEEVVRAVHARTAPWAEATRPADLPTTIGVFRVIERLGAGGMGVVYLAHDPALDRRVAVKIMRPERAADPDSRQRFMREARAAAMIRHDNVVPIYHVDENGGNPYLVMPALTGTSLDKWLAREPQPPLDFVLKTGREVALGLAVAHARGLVHRDVKPANVWLEGAEGRVDRALVLDFGLARAADGSDKLTSSNVIVGTIGYMAPEQADAADVDARADLFSLGCVLYRMLTGNLPFRGGTLTAVVRAMATQPPTPPRELNSAVPYDLSDLVLRLIEREPERRPASAEAVAADLAQFSADLTSVQVAVWPPGIDAGEVLSLWKSFPALATPEARPNCEHALGVVAARLGDPTFRVSVVGRWRQGKTTLINRLVGADAVPTGPTVWAASRVAVRWAARSFARFYFPATGLLDGWPDDIVALRAAGGPCEVPLDRLAAHLAGVPEDIEVRAERLDIAVPCDVLRGEIELLDSPGIDTKLPPELWADALDAADFVILVAERGLLPPDLTLLARQVRPRGHDRVAVALSGMSKLGHPPSKADEAARATAAACAQIPPDAVFLFDLHSAEPETRAETDRLAGRLRAGADDRRAGKARSALLRLRDHAAAAFGPRPVGLRAALVDRVRALLGDGKSGNPNEGGAR